LKHNPDKPKAALGANRLCLTKMQLPSENPSLMIADPRTGSLFCQEAALVHKA
jgi:hypothetical protein